MFVTVFDHHLLLARFIDLCVVVCDPREVLPIYLNLYFLTPRVDEPSRRLVQRRREPRHARGPLPLSPPSLGWGVAVDGARVFVGARRGAAAQFAAQLQAAQAEREHRVLEGAAALALALQVAGADDRPGLGGE